MRPDDRRVVYLMEGDTFAAVAARETSEEWEPFDKITNTGSRALVLRRRKS